MFGNLVNFKSYALILSVTVILTVSSLPLVNGYSPNALNPSPLFRPPLLAKQNVTDSIAGYQFDKPTNVVDNISAFVVVPQVKCGKPESTAEFGIALFNDTNSSDYIYTAIGADCQSGSVSYSAYWYNYADGLGVTASWAPKAGDKIFLEIGDYELSGFHIVIIDETNQSETYALKLTPDWGASTGGQCAAGLTGFADKVANFGTATLTNCVASVVRKTGGIGSFTGLVQYTDVSESGKVIMQPSSLTHNMNFTIKWKSSGP
jgi:hypothetical protein